MMSCRRVVLTGMGLVTPLGQDVATTWSSLLSGKCGVKPLSQCPEYLPKGTSEGRAKNLTEGMPCTVAAPVGEDVHVFKATSRETRAQQMLKKAAQEALEDSKLIDANGSDVKCYDLLNVGVCIGTGMPSIQDVTDAAASLYHQPGDNVAANKIGPFFVPKILGNTPAGGMAIKYKLQGPVSCPMTACATGAHCIADAARWIQTGEADCVLCGATESCITPIGIAGFARMKALSTKYNDKPAAASRPFDKNRAGFVMGEGAGVLVLEEYEAAKARGATIYAEVAGCGATCDAHHVSSPHPDGRGAARCIERALAMSGLKPEEVGYVNAHATGTPMGDEIEAQAIMRTLRPVTDSEATSHPPVQVSSTKGALGHLLGAAGAVEAIVTAKALHCGEAPATLNLEDAIEHDASRIQLLGSKGETCSRLPENTKAALCTSFGFGGANAAVLFATCS